MDFDPQISSIPYEVKNASQNTGIDTASDTVAIKAGGVAGVIASTATKNHFNSGSNDVDNQFSGTTEPFVVFVDGGNNAAGFGTDDPTYTREGGMRAARFGSLKADTATSNAGFFALASTAGQRAVDIEFLKCSGTWVSKGAVANGDVVLNLGSLGHDGTDFNRSAVIQTFIDGVVSDNVVPMGWAYQTSTTNGGGLVNRMRIRANGVIQLGGPIA